MKKEKNVSFVPVNMCWKNSQGVYLYTHCVGDWSDQLNFMRDVDGKTDHEIFTKEQANELILADKQVIDHEKSLRLEAIIVTENKKEHLLIIDKVPWKNEKGDVIGVATSFFDVTSDESANEESKEAQTMACYLDKVVACTPGLVYWKDRESRYLGVNDFFVEMTGLRSREDALGKTDEELFGKNSKTRIIMENDKKVITTGKPITIEEIGVMVTGERRHFVAQKIPLIDSKGNIAGVIGSSIDVTDRKIAETLEKERAVLERENAIGAMRIETINRFCRKLLHDIRSPLSTLRMLITVLCKATLDGDSTVDLVRIRATAYRCIRRIEAMANSFLRKYRQQANEEELPSEPTLLMPLVVDALLEKRSTLSMEDIKLHQEMQGAHSLSSTVECFELVQIFSNLINNCAEAIVEKREKLGDKKAKGLVCFKMTEQKEHIHFAISDNGCGIPQDLLEDIFLKDKTTKKEGSGIGLFHAREGIDSWGGKIWAESQEGEGSTMNILLPKSEAPPQWFATQIEVPRNGILAVVDDEPHLYYSMKKLIEEQGLTEDVHLVEIKTLSEFTEWYEEHKEENPIILMDYLFYNEQRRTGLDVIKENELENAILVTNIYDDVFLRKECTDAGVQLIPKNIIDRIPILLK